jgi:hypothetical protein
MINEWWSGRKRSLPILMYYPGLCLERLNKTTKSLRIAGIRAVIWIRYLRIRSRNVNQLLVSILVIVKASILVLDEWQTGVKALSLTGAVCFSIRTCELLKCRLRKCAYKRITSVHEPALCLWGRLHSLRIDRGTVRLNENLDGLSPSFLTNDDVGHWSRQGEVLIFLIAISLSSLYFTLCYVA